MRCDGRRLCRVTSYSSNKKQRNSEYVMGDAVIVLCHCLVLIDGDTAGWQVIEVRSSRLKIYFVPVIWLKSHFWNYIFRYRLLLIFNQPFQSVDLGILFCHLRRILQTASGLLLFEVKFGQFSKWSNIDVLYIIGKGI